MVESVIRCRVICYLIHYKTIYRESSLEPVYQMSASVIGQYIYSFGGCELLSTCYNTMNVFNDNDPCPNNCNSNGVCRNGMCMCSSGFSGKPLIFLNSKIWRKWLFNYNNLPSRLFRARNMPINWIMCMLSWIHRYLLNRIIAYLI